MSNIQATQASSLLLPKVPDVVQDEIKLVKLAREIAMGVNSISVILERFGLDLNHWEDIKVNARFNALLASEMTAWESAGNTAERVKLKSASMIEEWLPELYARLNDRSENLSAKIEGGKLVRDLAGLGGRNLTAEGGLGNQVSVTINLGADVKLTYKSEAPEEPKTIDVTPNAPANEDM